MVNVTFLVLGLALLLTVMIDALATTLAVRAGAGPLTQRLTASLWNLLLRLHRRDRPPSLLGVAGPALLMVTVLLWIGLLWAGWTLLFLSCDRGVIDSSTGAAANTAQVVYYVAFTIFTLGVGDFVPGGDGWRLLTAVATFSGLFLGHPHDHLPRVGGVRGGAAARPRAAGARAGVHGRDHCRAAGTVRRSARRSFNN